MELRLFHLLKYFIEKYQMMHLLKLLMIPKQHPPLPLHPRTKPAVRIMVIRKKRMMG